MAFSEEDLAVFGQFLESKIAPIAQTVENAIKRVEGVENAVAEGAAAVAAPQDRVSQVGAPDVHPEAGPKFYVHLADGSVIESYDSTSTHLDVDGKSVAVIGRYQMGA